MMTTSERSIYMDLLYCVYEYAGSIPSDQQRLAVLAAVSQDELNKAWPVVSRNFVACDDDPTMLTNLVALETMRRQASVHEVKTKAGRAGGLASGLSRKQKRTTVESEVGSKPEPYREDKNQTREEKKKREEENTRAPSASFSDSQHEESPAVNEDEFLARYPKKVGQAAARSAYRSIITGESLHSALMEGLARWLESDQWSRSEAEDGGRYIPNGANFIIDKLWAEYPPAAKAAKVDPIAEAVRNIKNREVKQ